MEIKVIIIDDEPLARKRIANLLSEFEEIILIDECATGKKAIQSINKFNPDLIYLDIHLKDMTGFNVIEKIEKDINPSIIFITAFDEFAIKAFELFVFDYLLKPFKDERFFESTKKVISYINKKEVEYFGENLKNLINHFSENVELNTNPIEKIPIKVGNKVLFVNTQEIKYITASGYYSEIFTETKKYLLRESLSNLIIKLDQNYFIRIHRSHIINLNFIQELISSNYGEIDVKMNDNRLFRISKSYKKEFLIKMRL